MRADKSGQVWQQIDFREWYNENCENRNIYGLYRKFLSLNLILELDT